MSYYVIECLCGHTFRPREKECVCPSCGRSIRIEWGADGNAAAAKAKQAPL